MVHEKKTDSKSKSQQQQTPSPVAVRRRQDASKTPVGRQSESESEDDEQASDTSLSNSCEHPEDLTENDDNIDLSSDTANARLSLIIPPKAPSHSYLWVGLAFALVSFITIQWMGTRTNDSDSSLHNQNWRSRIDPNTRMSDHQRSTVFASLKPILDKSSSQAESVSTLLILSSNEQNAAELAQCLLKIVNTIQFRNQLSSEIDIRLLGNNKLQLDTDLQSLLTPDDSIRAVLLRHIDDLSSHDDIEQLRLLFAYCDGENPRIPNRLIIMTATSNSIDESDLRETFKVRWAKEHDFIDALMSRISGHTFYVQQDQKSIC